MNAAIEKFAAKRLDLHAVYRHGILVDVPKQEIASVVDRRIATTYRQQVVTARMHALAQPRKAEAFNLVMQEISKPFFADVLTAVVAAHRVDAGDLNQLLQQIDRVENHRIRL